MQGKVLDTNGNAIANALVAQRPSITVDVLEGQARFDIVLAKV